MGVRVDVDAQSIQRILVREVNWVGDAVLTLPALEALDRRFPQAEITVLAKSWVHGLFLGHPAVDFTIEYRSKDTHRGLAGRFHLARDLRERSFDLVVIFPNSFDSALIPWLARIPHRVGYPADGRGWLLTHPIHAQAGLPGRHQVERYLDIVRAVGGDGTWSFRLPVAAAAQQSAQQLLADHRIAPADFVVAVTPGSMYGGAKRWPTEQFAAVADRLAERYAARILLIGSERERPILAQVAVRMRRSAVNLGGRTDLASLMGVLARSRLLLTNDTGAMHLAAAVGTPVLAIFGPTDEEATGPLGAHSRVVRERVPCSPCLLRECPIDHRCMTHVTVDQVLRGAMDLLNDSFGSRFSARGSPAAFLDRDGTVIEDVGYLGDPHGIQFIPRAIDALRALKEAGFRLVLVTNQAGVARGLITETDVRAVNERLADLLAQARVPLDGMYYCPHHPDHGPPEYRRQCNCRKPKPGLIQQATRDLDLDTARSVVIGDHVSDATLADAFPGMRGIMVRTGHGNDQWEKIQAGSLTRPAHVADDLRAAVDWFLTQEKRRDAIGTH